MSAPLSKSAVLAILTLVTTSWLASATSDNPDPKIQAAFEKRFPGVKNVHWEQNAAKDYVAWFYFQEGEAEASFSKSGLWKYTKIEFLPDAIPEPIEEFLNEDYPDGVFMESHTYEDPRTPLRYVIILSLEENEESNDDSTYIQLVFDKNGKYLSLMEVSY